MVPRHTPEDEGPLLGQPRLPALNRAGSSFSFREAMSFEPVSISISVMADNQLKSENSENQTSSP